MYYVLIMGIPEEIFWYADFPFLKNVAENKSAYEGWLNSAMAKERERKFGKK